MTLENALRYGIHELEKESIQSSQLDSRLLLEHATGFSHSDVISKPHQILSQNNVTHFQNLIRRRATHEPIAYILGQKEFYSLNFKVTPDVLIPRPETEHLVEYVTNKVKNSNAKILEIGTGSGAIAVAIATNCKNALIHATDISKDALEIAKANAQLHKIETIDFLYGNLFKPVCHKHFYDYILSNPPYVPEDNYANLEKNIFFEPKRALTSGIDGLDIIKELIKESPKFLKDNGMLIFEFDISQHRQIFNLFNINYPSMFEATFINDYTHRPRICIAKRLKNSEVSKCVY